MQVDFVSYHITHSNVDYVPTMSTATTKNTFTENEVPR